MLFFALCAIIGLLGFIARQHMTDEQKQRIDKVVKIIAIILLCLCISICSNCNRGAIRIF